MSGAVEKGPRRGAFTFNTHSSYGLTQTVIINCLLDIWHPITTLYPPFPRSPFLPTSRSAQPTRPAHSIKTLAALYIYI